MKSNKEYRFEQNPDEKCLYDNFINAFKDDSRGLSAIIFGWSDDAQSHPNNYLTAGERDACLGIIQWLGSPVGQFFLSTCGFVKKEI